ncbi:MAG: hypothetical protein M1830_008102 [Pleopsidium flavum]|nr:MAG: hypothetical protein M1830_008102 [Pleopsidium flavum]
MIILLTLSLLVSLGAAAPVADDQPLSPQLQKRAVGCHIEYGSDIVPGDCDQAIRKMRQMPTVDVNPRTGWLIPLSGEFSRTQPDGRFRLPQSFRFGTCTIIVGMSNPAETVTSGWGQVSAGAHYVIEQCVVLKGQIGGIDDRNGFDTLVVNERTMSQRLSDAWHECRLQIQSQHLLDPDAQCLINVFEMEAASQAASDRSSSK